MASEHEKAMGATDSHAKRLIKNTGIFAIGTFGSKILTLLIIPLCTRYIVTADMGVYDMVYTVVALLQPIAILAIPESLFRWIIDSKADKRAVYSTWLTLFIVLSAVFTVVYWACWLIIGFGDAPLMYALVILSCLYQSLQYGTRGLHNNRLFAVSGMLYAAIYCAACFALVVVLGVGYRGLLYAMLVATVVASVLLLVPQRELRSFASSGIDRALAKEMLRYSLFLLPNQLSWWAMTMLCRLIIVGFMGYSANGIFSVAMKFPSALTMVSTIFTPAWQEQAITLFDSDGKGSYFSKVFNQYAVLLLTLLIPGVPLTKLFVQVAMDPAYYSCFDVVAVLYIGAAVNALSSFVGVLYLCAKDTKGAASTTILGAVANMALSVVLVPLIGLMGAALGNLVGNAVILIVRLRQTRKYCALHVQWAKFLYCATLVTVSSLVTASLPSLAAIAVFTAACLLAFAMTNRKSAKALLGFARRR